MTEIKTPDSIIDELAKLRNHIAKSARAIEAAEREYLTAKHEYDRAYAMAYGTATGSIEDRKQQATLATLEESARMNAAQVALGYAKNTSRSLDAQQSNLQTQARLVEVLYRLAGVGET